ncbi:MAG: fibrobacter succinogenes major paralogous domain-containing protein [Bacteroidales bacterium]|nr:fibrobacter succinogenes major paralogous domain-containing protein [Bacteroidales bacterium]
MKKITTFIVLLLICVTGIFAQAPEKFTYQAVVRNANNSLVTNTLVGVRVSVLQGSATGNSVYVETQMPSTNTNGLITLIIGDGNAVFGSFDGIDWSSGPFFLKTEIDPNGGNSYSVATTQQLMSVPYALYAKEAGNAFSGDYNDLTNTPAIPTVPANVSAFTNDAGYITGYAETDPQFNAWDKDYNDLINTPVIPTVPTNVSAFTNDAGYITVDSVPAVPTNVSAFTNDAGYITGYAETDPQFNAWDKDYNDLTNKPVLFDGDYNTLTNRPVIPAVPTNVSAFTNDAGYITMDSIPAIPSVPTNVSAFTNDAGYITGYTETDPQFNTWDKDYNDLINRPVLFDGDYNTLTNKPIIPTVPTNVSAFTNDAQYITAADIPTNVSAFENDAQYITAAELYTLLNTLNNTIDSLRNRIEELESGQNPPAPVVQLPTVSTGSISEITTTSALGGGSVIDNGGADITACGVCWDTVPEPSIDAAHTTDSLGTGQFVSQMEGLLPSTTYYVRAYATNSAGTAYGEAVVFTTSEPSQDAQACPGFPTVTDYDGNVYNTVMIGEQCWMKENLRTKHYADGTAIDEAFGTSNTEAYRYNPNNDSSYVAVYGYLYNWKAVMRNANSSAANPSDVQGICPSGWHVPSNSEWVQLTDYVASQSDYDCDGVAAALAAPSGWNTSSGCDVGGYPATTNATGFSALPAGYYNGYYSNHYFGQRAQFWSATDNGYESAAYEELRHNLSLDMRSTSVKYSGKSVRCVRGTAADETVPDTTSVTPSDTLPCHGETTVSDYDGNVYHTVQIGQQCWIKENIRSTHYSDGTVIALGTATSGTVPYRYYPNDDSANVATYGYLYNRSALMNGVSTSHAIPSGVQGVCPAGWHVPSQPEWLQLCDYMGTQSEYLCGNNSAYIGKALAATEGWASSTSDCAIGNDLSANNASGFGALPAGRYNGTNGLYAMFGSNAYFWTSTLGDGSAGYNFYLYNGGIGVNRNNMYSPTYGLSVRCIQD